MRYKRRPPRTHPRIAAPRQDTQAQGCIAACLYKYHLLAPYYHPAGTVAYMAPEVCSMTSAAQHYCGSKCDVWSLGVMLYVAVAAWDLVVQ